MKRVVVATTLILALAAGTRGASTDAVAAAADIYAAGQHDAAVAALRKSTGLKVADLTGGLEGWISAGAIANRATRARVAAVFALDVVWISRLPQFGHARENRDPRVTPNQPDRVPVSGLLALGYVPRWSARTFPTDGAVDAFERTFWLAAIGVVEEGSAWRLLQDDVLPLARRRLQDEPRVALADVLARTNRELGPLRETKTFRRGDLLADDAFGSHVTRHIPSAIKAFETLLERPALAGEVELRIGYLELRRRRWDAALARFERARTRLEEPLLLAMADYFAGWVHEERKNVDAAIAAYRRAHAIVPTMNNLSARLAALLFLGNERTEAYAILDRAFNTLEPPRDLLIALERADARFVDGHLGAMRAALK